MSMFLQLLTVTKFLSHYYTFFLSVTNLLISEAPFRPITSAWATPRWTHLYFGSQPTIGMRCRRVLRENVWRRCFRQSIRWHPSRTSVYTEIGQAHHRPTTSMQAS